jgi:hypothetical protein
MMVTNVSTVHDSTLYFPFRNISTKFLCFLDVPHVVLNSTIPQLLLPLSIEWIPRGFRSTTTVPIFSISVHRRDHHLTFR